MWLCASRWLTFSLSDHSTPLYVIAALLIVAGQILNAQVYQALGKTGVYYGILFVVLRRDFLCCCRQQFKICFLRLYFR
jgi:hypothetical protein